MDRSATLELLLPRPAQRLAPGPRVALAERLEVAHRGVGVRGDRQPVAGVRQRQHGREPAPAVLDVVPRRAAPRAVVEVVVELLATAAADVEPAVEACVVEIGQTLDEPRAGASRPGGDGASGRQRVRHVALPGRSHIDVLAVPFNLPLVPTLGAGVVTCSDPEHAGTDDDLPARPLGDHAGLADRAGRDVRDQVGRVLDQLRARERRPPQPSDREGVLVLTADRYGTWDKPGPGRRARPGNGRAPGGARPARRSCLRPAAGGRRRPARPVAVDESGPARGAHAPCSRETMPTFEAVESTAEPCRTAPPADSDR